MFDYNQHETVDVVQLNLLYLRDRMKLIIVQIVDNDHRNNLVKFGKDSPLSGPLKSKVIPILLKIEMVKFLKNLHIVLIVEKQIFQIKH